MILWLSEKDAKALRQIPIEVGRIADEIVSLRAEMARIAVALEMLPEPRTPATAVWTHGSPQEE